MIKNGIPMAALYLTHKVSKENEYDKVITAKKAWINS